MTWCLLKHAGGLRLAEGLPGKDGEGAQGGDEAHRRGDDGQDEGACHQAGRRRDRRRLIVLRPGAAPRIELHLIEDEAGPAPPLSADPGGS